MTTALVFTPAQAFEAYLLGMAVGLLVAGLVLVAWLNYRANAVTRLPERLHRHHDDEPTERIDTATVHDLPRKGLR